ncbi:hypothetical protein [uncultured Clostridium sp.]|uniref:hypothetical protein n=1 Tax=uncultured Clostridium sp. TaxID=59620 RepID=UPI0025D90F2D|nr:hypothetical protein [uncultured Clostridium sp.]
MKVLLDDFTDTSKAVRVHIIELLEESSEYFDKILLKLKAKKQGEREVAARGIGKWLENPKVDDEIKEKINESLKDLKCV